MNESTWIVIANRVGVRILEHRAARLTLVAQREHPQGEAKRGALETDRPGRGFEHGGPGRHALGRHETAHDHAGLELAHQLADELRIARNQQRFRRLVLVAEPRFLGMLRSALDDATQSVIGATLGKDLGHVETRNLEPHIKDVLRI
jgi:protein required for attachment to host cells